MNVSTPPPCEKVLSEYRHNPQRKQMTEEEKQRLVSALSRRSFQANAQHQVKKPKVEEALAESKKEETLLIYHQRSKETQSSRCAVHLRLLANDTTLKHWDRSTIQL